MRALHGRRNCSPFVQCECRTILIRRVDVGTSARVTSHGKRDAFAYSGNMRAYMFCSIFSGAWSNCFAREKNENVFRVFTTRCQLQLACPVACKCTHIDACLLYSKWRNIYFIFRWDSNIFFRCCCCWCGIAMRSRRGRQHSNSHLSNSHFIASTRMEIIT